MLARDLQSSLVNWTVANSGHDVKRPYIGLSGIADCEQVIYDRYMFGAPANVLDHLKSRLSYELEEALIERLTKIGVYHLGPEICLYDGLVQGHTDGMVEQDLLEIKTVSRLAHMPEDRLPSRVFWQVQAYMLYGRVAWTKVVYMARETGDVRVYSIRFNESVQLAIDEKVTRLVEAVRSCERPQCSCGRCK